MTPIARAYTAGRAARDAGQEATSNPHDDVDLGSAWAAGWHEHVFLPPHSMLAMQCESIKALIRLEGCCPRVGACA